MVKTVVYCTDANYLPHLAASMRSLADTAQSAYQVVVFASELPRKQSRELSSFGGSLGLHPVIHDVDESAFADLALIPHVTSATYFRLLAPDYITESTCLYLDAGTLVRSPIDKAFEVDLGNYYLAAVEERGQFARHTELGMRPESRYFNAGVLLLNLDVWRTEQVRSRTLEFAQRFPDALRWADQCALNAVVDGRWIDLDAQFNVRTDALRQDPSGVREAIEKAKIVHFCGSKKPWVLGSEDPFRRLYWKHRQRTPFRLSLQDRRPFLRHELAQKKNRMLAFLGSLLRHRDAGS